MRAFAVCCIYYDVVNIGYMFLGRVAMYIYIWKSSDSLAIML